MKRVHSALAWLFSTDPAAISQRERRRTFWASCHRTSHRRRRHRRHRRRCCGPVWWAAPAMILQKRGWRVNSQHLRRRNASHRPNWTLPDADSTSLPATSGKKNWVPSFIQWNWFLETDLWHGVVVIAPVLDVFQRSSSRKRSDATGGEVEWRRWERLKAVEGGGVVERQPHRWRWSRRRAVNAVQQRVQRQWVVVRMVQGGVECCIQIGQRGRRQWRRVEQVLRRCHRGSTYCQWPPFNHFLIAILWGSIRFNSLKAHF